MYVDRGVMYDDEGCIGTSSVLMCLYVMYVYEDIHIVGTYKHKFTHVQVPIK